MSATITLKHTMARSRGAASDLVHYSLMIAAVLIVLGIIHVFVSSARSVDVPEYALPGLPNLADLTDLAIASETLEAVPTAESVPAVLSSRMQGALDYVTRRYRVSPEALVPVFEVAQLIGQERRIDPLLIVAIIGIESGFNPFAESAMGARGLMQIIPRFHRDKVPEGAGDGSLLDPVVNIRVGVYVLEEAIRRRGGLVAGLQYYAGSSEPAGSYASKVLAEKERLEQAARRNAAAV
ncbi:MAG: Lytic transglycosylase catalytic [Proteobacteria bacterium]|nr:Lytic transglycosylase catalytic [Pseudomonadota bacterium]